MTSADLADLNGLLAFEAAARAKTGDTRDKSDIATAVLAEIGAPDLALPIRRLTRMVARRPRPGKIISLAAWRDSHPRD